jgi:hypothetical protein
LACTRLLVVIETDAGERLERVWRHEGALSSTGIVDRVRWQLDGWLNGPSAQRPSGGVSRLLLVPDEVMPARGRQHGFWGGETEADERAGRALARVQGQAWTQGTAKCHTKQPPASTPPDRRAFSFLRRYPLRPSVGLVRGSWLVRRLRGLRESTAAVPLRWSLRPSTAVASPWPSICGSRCPGQSCRRCCISRPELCSRLCLE